MGRRRGRWRLAARPRGAGAAGPRPPERLLPRGPAVPGATLDLDAALTGIDVVLVHERSDPELVRRLGEHRAHTDRYRLFFHDTHHGIITDPAAIVRRDLSGYDFSPGRDYLVARMRSSRSTISRRARRPTWLT